MADFETESKMTTADLVSVSEALKLLRKNSSEVLLEKIQVNIVDIMCCIGVFKLIVKEQMDGLYYKNKKNVLNMKRYLFHSLDNLKEKIYLIWNLEYYFSYG